MADYAMLLREHVTLTCRSIDRLFLQAYVPKLQSVGMVCNFLCKQRGFPIPSSAAFAKMGRPMLPRCTASPRPTTSRFTPSPRAKTKSSSRGR